MELINPINLPDFKHVLVTDVQMQDGTTTKVITLFDNNKVGMEEINIGVKRALEFTSTTKAMQSASCSIDNGVLNTHSIFEKQEIEHYDPAADYRHYTNYKNGTL